MSKEENYICGYNDGVADVHEQYDLFPITENVNKDIAYIEEWLKDEYALNSRDREVLITAIHSMKSVTALSNAIQDTVEELNHIATEPYDVDDYQEGVTDGIQLAIKTINTKIKDCKNSGGNVTNEEIEEAIDLLDNLIGVVEDNHGSDYDKAIKMGIGALKRLSNTSNDERR